MTEFIKSVRDAGVLTPVIDRRAKKNALTDAMYSALAVFERSPTSFLRAY